MDLKTFFFGDEQRCDWQTAALGLAEGDELDTAVLLSLFTDRRAAPNDDVEGDPRGWWGDAIAVGDERAVPLGSRLWLLAREKQTASALRRAEAYGREALQWLIDDGHARSVSVAASAPRLGLLRLDIAIDSQPYRFELTP
ncbi:hypothetical protein GCM10007860_09200 [Chitiniphilus shinanonensis]|uniref:GP46 family protein n=1 Tax=Chitiniphilus shinanonensis TaxID=553088 RepID=A0ABQ6BP29_9NEIS|nr:phage GP46 family protein [Chitiniphilus shinanonensis]GLS03775.1 hypothetical protein GCM10007860_09200 [Chitiniphilus shinanonensis]